MFLAALGGCDDFNRPVKDEIEYHLSIAPVNNWDELRSAINAVPDGGSARLALTAGTEAAVPITVNNGKTITLEAYKGAAARIGRAAGFDGAFFELPAGGSLILNGGQDGGTLALDGGAVWNEDHTAIAGGLTAANPLISIDGGFLALNNGAELRNNNNTSSNGGGVYVNGGSFNMSGGAISGNAGASGGGVYISIGSFKMNEGAISENKANSYGGGVNVGSGGFEMNGGTISKNSVQGGYGSGGGVCVYGTGRNFEMNGGTISRNKVYGGEGGGGVFAGYGGSFVMNRGDVSGNEAVSGPGGGVGIHYGHFYMNGGSVSGNTCEGNGGGVYENGTFNISGGTVSGNSCGGDGGGVYVGNYGITMSASAVIDAGNPVYLSSGRCITVAGPLSPPGGIAAVIEAADTSPGTVIVMGDYSPVYTLTKGDVEKFRYHDAGTPLAWDGTGETGTIPGP